MRKRLLVSFVFGALGLAAVDFKLTDAYCDPPENQAYLIETLLPMQGCAYPYRHVAPSASRYHSNARGLSWRDA